MVDLFSKAGEDFRKEQAPLAERLRPREPSEVMGQEQLLGPGKLLSSLMAQDKIPSLIFWGPPGSGKTTLAQVMATQTKAKFIALSAVLSGVKELREVIAQAKEDLNFKQTRSLVFIDEIHRFNKAQQDALLPHVEDGTITLIGATTENPSFEVIGPLLSRTRVLVLEPLNEKHLQALVARGLQLIQCQLDEDAQDLLIQYAGGDARRLLNTLELAAQLATSSQQNNTKTISLATLKEALQKPHLRYDKSGEEHYNLISAFIKSMRASDPDAAIYYLARMYEAGEDPRFLARRMVIFAAEDVGLADPQALSLAVSAAQAYDFIGQAEGWIPLSEAATYLAKAPKSNASYQAYKNAKAEIQESGNLPTPLQLRNAPTKLMKNLNYGKDYKYAHSDPKGSEAMECLPEKIKHKKFLKD